MLLNDLSKHTPAQEEAIKKLSRGVDSTTFVYSYWNEVWKSLWGKPVGSFQKEEAVKRDKSDPVNDVLVPRRHLVASLPKTLDPCRYSKQMLVRSEYDEAEQAALVSNESGFDVFVVTGQPGIGKSDFLSWLLIHRLALRLPTVLQTGGSHVLLFHESGVSGLTHLDDYSYQLKQKDDSSRIWALVDTQEPARVFRLCSPFFIVLVAYPLSDHIGWLRKIRFEEFYMRPWSISEVFQVRAFLHGNYTERRLWDMHNEFGASLRSMAFYANGMSTYKSHLFREIGSLDQTSAAFLNPKSHYTVTIVPSPTYRSRFVATIPSRCVFELLWRRVAYYTREMWVLYDLFCESPISAAAAGWIFKFRMHQLLREKQSLELFPILGHRGEANLIYDNYTSTNERNNPTILQLTRSEGCPFVSGAKLWKNCYYLLESTNSAIDSLLLICPPDELPILLMFRIIHGREELEMNMDGLRDVNDSNVSPKARRYYVVVTPEDFQPEVKVPTEYLGNKGIIKKFFFLYPDGTADDTR